MRRVVLSILGVALIFLGLSTASSEAHAAGSASVTVVQALPGATVVRQWIRPGSAIDSVVLALPDVPGTARLYADKVEVVADGTPAEGPGRIAGGPATYTFDATTDGRGTDRVLAKVDLG